jgi:hypothetical protein
VERITIDKAGIATFVVRGGMPVQQTTNVFHEAVAERLSRDLPVKVVSALPMTGLLLGATHAPVRQAATSVVGAKMPSSS